MYSFKAVIFDLDGVVTKTALLHARAWKEVFDEYLRLREERNKEPFREFRIEEDYLSYVDGKPRYKGVESFLLSRGIDIAWGDPQDSPDKETVCGLGNKKNRKFLELLKKEGAQVYETTVQFIKRLREAGVKIGLASSSKNCRAIIESVGIEDLFETVVDGIVSSELGLKGKPEGDIFTTAAYNLKTAPSQAVVVEDATSGVEAGRNGGFGLVIGVAGENNKSELFKNGADIVVGDLSQIDLEEIERWFQKNPPHLFFLWDKEIEIDNGEKVNPCYFRNGKSIFSGNRTPAFFLDYDGTLTPIVERPEMAIISDDVRVLLKSLSKKYITAIISGRKREEVQGLVKIPGLFYAGSHGLDIQGPGISRIEPRAEETAPLISKITKDLKERLGNIPGVLIEEKKFSVALHYRLVEDRFLSEIKDTLDWIIKENSELRLMSGKKVFEVLPAIDWDKGKAVRWIMEALSISWSKNSIIYIGDDTTDEDAFRIIRTRGTGILVSRESCNSCADFRLDSPEEVKKFLKKVIEEDIS